MQLLEGVYKASDHFYKILKIENGVATAMQGEMLFHVKIEYGEFGDADPEVERRTGEKGCNVKMMIWMPGQDTEAPPGPYKLQPEKEGRIIWLSGAPGSGKSTSGQLLAREDGYVYYEADCFGSLKNPYIPLDTDNPSGAQIYQKILRGPGMEERKAVIDRSIAEWGKVLQGKEYNKEGIIEYYHHLAMDIEREKKRIGGDFVIATLLMSAEIREKMRSWLGSDLRILILSLSNEERRERILGRHGGDAGAADMMDCIESLMEGIEENEPNTAEIKINKSMTKQEVLENIRQQLEEMK